MKPNADVVEMLPFSVLVPVDRFVAPNLLATDVGGNPATCQQIRATDHHVAVTRPEPDQRMLVY